MSSNPIGFMDSGVGGISVLREAVKLLPHENFIYYGDSANAPYGTRPKEEIVYLADNALQFLLNKDAKAIVIACNTATSFAINELRSKYNNIPIIGIEPAVKPAAIMCKDSKIIIMATPMTLQGEKFAKLVAEHANGKQIVPMPCPGLMELVESGESLTGEAVRVYLQNVLKDYIYDNVAVIVLGCTHYPFIKPQLQRLFPEETVIIDGSYGTSMQLLNKLREFNLLNLSREIGTVHIFNSSSDKHMVELSERLLYL